MVLTYDGYNEAIEEKQQKESELQKLREKQELPRLSFLACKIFLSHIAATANVAPDATPSSTRITTLSFIVTLPNLDIGAIFSLFPGSALIFQFQYTLMVLLDCDSNKSSHPTLLHQTQSLRY